MPDSTLIVYESAKRALLKGLIPLEGTALRAVLLGASYTPQQQGHVTWADAVAHEVTGPGYTAGGRPLPPPVGVATYGSKTWLTIGSPVTWAGATLAAKYALVVSSTVPEIVSDALLFAYLDLNPGGSSVAVSTGTLSLNWTDNLFLSLT